ncbi:hypothetical protein ACFRCG_04840 [Embleya sp. NPDC056575]|uniref:hypothetical protein n=1 Tax=unclassified Embleya TaxID=2699296 RepID=UPI0036C9F50D
MIAAVPELTSVKLAGHGPDIDRPPPHDGMSGPRGPGPPFIHFEQSGKARAPQPCCGRQHDDREPGHHAQRRRRGGRLDDGWDEEFGRSELRTVEEGRVEVSLWRYADDDWMVSLDYARDPLPVDETEALRRTILHAAARAGLAITAQGRGRAG